VSTAAARQRAVYGALVRLESQAHTLRLEDESRPATVHAMISGHEVQARVSVPHKGTGRMNWRLDGVATPWKKLQKFLLAEAGQEVPQ
jgi:hypothetical protein